MIRGILRKILRPVLGKRKAAIVAEGLDQVAKKVIDRKTGGLASKVDEVL